MLPARELVLFCLRNSIPNAFLSQALSPRAQARSVDEHELMAIALAAQK